MSDSLASAGWVTTWAASAQGRYPVGAAIAQPDLTAAFPVPDAGARDQAMRMVLRPARHAARIRLRFCNFFGDRPLCLRQVNVALHQGGGALVPATQTMASFSRLEVAAGSVAWTPPIELPWVAAWPAMALQGRDLAVSWSVQGESGPMSWHAKAMTTSYLSDPGQPGACIDMGASGLPHTTTSWYFIDAVDAWVDHGAQALVALGDSLTDGTATTLNGHDRWTDVLQRQLRLAGREDLLVVNAGIGGNQVAGPVASGNATPWRGGPSAMERLERDVLSLSGVSTVLWIEGINDLSANGQRSSAELLVAIDQVAQRLRARGLRVIGATLPSALQSSRPGHGGSQQDEQRRAFNQQLRLQHPFDALMDLDALMTDPLTGRLRREFNGDSTFGEPGDGVHVNRAGHACMAQCALQALRL